MVTGTQTLTYLLPTEVLGEDIVVGDVIVWGDQEHAVEAITELSTARDLKMSEGVDLSVGLHDHYLIYR